VQTKGEIKKKDPSMGDQQECCNTAYMELALCRALVNVTIGSSEDPTFNTIPYTVKKIGRCVYWDAVCRISVNCRGPSGCR